jgi:zinc transport system substrate-binding protein
VKLFSALFLLLAWAGSLAGAAEPSPPRVLTTMFPIYCFASAVIGENGKVENLLPASVGPHDYQLAPSDYRKIRDADLVFTVGVGLESWLAKALKPSDPRVTDLSKAFEKDLLKGSPHLDLEGPHKHAHDHDHDHEHAGQNPHYWLDPTFAIRCVTNILARVQKIDPSRAADYAKNADAYIARLKALDTEISAQLKPVAAQPFITHHDAFPYFVKRYNLTLAGVMEITPDVAPSPRYLSDLLKVVREKKVQVIFTEPQFSSRLARQIAKDANIRVAQLDTLETGPLRKEAYEEGLRKNAATLLRELRK